MIFFKTMCPLLRILILDFLIMVLEFILQVSLILLQSAAFLRLNFENEVLLKYVLKASYHYFEGFFSKINSQFV